MINTIMVNGKITPDIGVMDRGCQYGDGVFETMRVSNEKIPLWPQHWQRLVKGCEVLSIELPNKAEIEQQITEIIRGIRKGIVKLLVTRGQGGRGYTVTEQLTPEVVLIQSNYLTYPAQFWQQGINVRTCHTRLSHQPALAGIKHMNRLEQVLARNEWSDKEITEGLMLDYQDNVVEGTITNLFIVKQDKVITPALKMCGVEGVMRETVLNILAREQIPCDISDISREMLMSADEVFLTNSVIGLWPVKKIDDTVYQPGCISRKLQDHINSLFNA